MFDIINKKNAFIAAAAVLLLCAFMVLMIGVVTVSKGCTEQVFTVQTLSDGSKTLVTTIDGQNITPHRIDTIEIAGETMTLWYNPVDNVIVQNYYMQSWGCIGIGLALAAIGTFILIDGFRRKKLV